MQAQGTWETVSTTAESDQGVCAQLELQFSVQMQIFSTVILVTAAGTSLYRKRDIAPLLLIQR